MTRPAIRTEPPAMVGLLSASAVAAHLSRGIRTGDEAPPQVALRKAATALPDQARWRTEPLRELLDEAMRRFEGGRTRRTAADAWLAPRIHATLRMSRAEAADSSLWNFIALLVAPDYVVWRHRGKEVAPAARFSGQHDTQAFARLWWAAELFRNGEDYRPVQTACRVQDILNTTMRLDVVDHRPTAMAVLRITDRLLEERAARPGDKVNALSSAINSAGSTLVYEVLAPDRGPDADAVHDWIRDAEGAPVVPLDRLPDGPDDGAVSEQAVQSLLPLFERMLADAPVRERKRRTVDDENPDQD